LTSFTAAQKKAIDHEGSNLVIFAVAGSGKTTVLVERIRKHAEAGESQLVLTFSKKAAESLNKRVGVPLTPSSFIGTFHSFCFKVLNRRCPNQYQNREVVEGREEWLLIKWAEELLRETPNAVGVPADMLRDISLLKLNGFHPDAWLAMTDRIHAHMNLGPGYVELLHALHQSIVKNGKYLFDDMIIDCLQLFRDDPELVDVLKNRLDHILVDEFQDTDPAQAEILKKLEKGNLVVVGDDDQSVYGFRGCSPRFIIEFPEIYGGVAISMEENFRSQAPILDAANQLIKCNDLRVDKVLRPTLTGEGAITSVRVKHPVEEAQYTADRIEEILDAGGMASDIAVLYRTNAQSGAFEDELSMRKIPYEVIDDQGGFYGRTEIRTLVSYLRLAARPNDITSLRWVLNKPNRFLRRDWVAECMGKSDGSAASVMQVMAATRGGFRQQQAAGSLCTLLQDLDMLVKEGHTPANIGHHIWQSLGFAGFIRELAARNQRKDPDEMMDAVSRVLMQTLPRFRTIKEFLTHVNLVEQESKSRQDGRSRVQLLTIHRAKGLEFPTVFIAGFCDGLIPHKNGREDEERRLAYVAITRAINHLYTTTYDIDSPFLKEMGVEPQAINMENEDAEITQDKDRTPGDLATKGGGLRVPGDEVGHG